jgi:hypothetical protein
VVDLRTVSGLHPTYVNNGTLSIAPGAELRLAFASEDAFTNGPGGTLSFGIASATRFGRITDISGGVALAGTASGFLTDGFVPALGTAFKVVDAHIASGTFGSVGGGFTASYPADRSSASLVFTGLPPAPGGGTTPPPADRTAPKLTGLKGLGTKLSLTSSEAGKVKLSITKSTSGRRVGGRCVKPSRSNRRRPRCTRTIAVATRSATLAAGTSSLALPKLPPGRYTVSLIATDAAGNRAKAVRATLVVKAKSKKRK